MINYGYNVCFLDILGFSNKISKEGGLDEIKTKYLKLDFVTMRIGGTSTKNIHNRLQITKEDVIACRRNGLYTNLFFISLKYLVKVFEFKL